VSRGVTLRIPAGGLVIGASPWSAPASATVELQLNTCVHWLEIAFDHLRVAIKAHDALLQIDHHDPGVGELLNLEFKSAMQACVASATFFEALHAASLKHDPLGKRVQGRSPGKRGSRYQRVTEQLRRSFGLKKRGTANLRSVLKEVYRFRREAVHPSATFTEPVLHQHLQVGVERRFIMFSFESARLLVRAALAFSKILPSRDLGSRPRGIQDLGAYLLKECAPLHAKWEQEYGPLLDPTPASN
jgi:hypothetical protein